MAIAKCPACGEDAKTKATRNLLNSNIAWLAAVEKVLPNLVVRRRFCADAECGNRWVTIELPLSVFRPLYLSGTEVIRELVQ